MNKFTFRTFHPSGPYSSFYPSTHYIKFKKFEIGLISDKTPHNIRLQVMKGERFADDNPNCSWKWMQFKREFESVEAAKEWLNSNVDGILKTYTLYGNKETGEECIIEEGKIQTIEKGTVRGYGR